MFTRIRRWIEDRWPVSAVLRLGLDEEIPGGASIAYTLGSATLFVFGLQVVTGVWQLFYYVPTVDHAYQSLDYLRTAVPFGWLLHGLHYWGANAMIILVALHLARVFVWGAYKKPREATWLLGVALLMLTMGMSFTGAPLPWDERGYWAAEVGTSIAGTVPVVGNTVMEILRGGPSMGQLTLSRFFVLHVALIPGALAFLVLLHLVAFRRFGSVGPWEEQPRQSSGSFWPDQVVRDAFVSLVVFIGLVALVTFAPPPFAGPADPVDSSYTPKPEWNFLFLYEALKLFKGPLEPLGTVGIPTVGVLILVLIPFLDRRTERNPVRRPVATMLGALGAGTVALFTVFGYYSNPGASRAAAMSSGPPVASVSHLSASARRGRDLVKSLGCQGCHTVGESGGSVGPDLTNEAQRGRSRAWLVQQLDNPQSHDSTSVMPSFSSLTSADHDAIVDYLMSLGADSTSAPAPGATPAGVGQDTTPAGVGQDTTPAGVGQDTTPAGDQQDTTVAGGASDTVTSPGSPPDTTIPAASTLGPPGPAASIIGNVQHGEGLFSSDCQSCHGEAGQGGVPNPGSLDGTVPALNPIDPALSDPDPEVFAANIDRFLQHGSVPDGPNPSLFMQPFGDRHTLTQEEIANLEAYVLSLNSVDRGTLQHTGMKPTTFLLLLVAVSCAFGLAGGGFWLAVRRK